ncbi:disulfide reductase, partial [Candidatus Woesearchaeota archaeon]
MNKESNNVLVVGAGISGIASALELANSGVNVYLLEKEAVIGGHSASFCCKATDVCSQCSACVVPDKIKETVSHPRIRLLTNSTIRRLSGERGNFRVVITQKPQYIDQERCIACGLCTAVCPADPKAIRPPFAEATPFSYVLDEELCLRFKGEKCDLCRKGCPTKAIKFKSESKEQELSVGALIVATGFDVFDAKKKGSLGYGRYPNVLTGLDLEQIFAREGCLKLPVSGAEPRNIAFIQCVGSRDKNHDYCSHVCCKYAMKLSGLIKYQTPDAQVTIFYIDLQTAGKGFAQFYEEYKKSIRFIRGVPVEILQTAAGELEVRFEDISQGKVCRDTFELIV